MDANSTCDFRRRLSAHYESVYRTNDFFGQDNALYRAFVAAIVKKSGVPPQARALDAGCGQGYLSTYLADCGLNVWCSDLSAAGLKSLDRNGQVFRSRRVVGDILHPPFQPAFDLVFQRSCSLFKNGPDECREVVDRLRDCAKPGAVVCIVVNSDMTGRGDSWFNHTLETFRNAFGAARLSELQIYAVNKIDCLLLGQYSFCEPVTRLNVLLSSFTTRSFELVALARRCD
jgi:SAM-dependent methyltransferase